VSLIAQDERPLLKAVERLLGYTLPTRTPQGYVPAPPRADERPQRRHEHRQQPARSGNRGQQPRNDGGHRHGGQNQRRGSRSSGRGQGGGGRN
jgi:hypothetical protein